MRETLLQAERFDGGGRRMAAFFFLPHKVDAKANVRQGLPDAPGICCHSLPVLSAVTGLSPKYLFTGWQARLRN